MSMNSWARSALHVMAATVAAAAGAYGADAALAWLRYGHVPHPADDESDHLRDVDVSY